MVKRRRTAIGARLGLASVLSLALVPGAQAGAFLIRDQTAAGFGMALAGVAAGGQLSYVFWNPAGLADIQTMQFEGVVTGVFPSIDISPDDGTNALVGAFGGTMTDEIDIARYAAVPASFSAIPLTDRLTLGLATTSPFGLATRAPYDWAGQIYSRKSEVFSINFNPMLGYRVNDWLAIGGGVQVEYLEAYLTQATGLAPDAPGASLKADDIGFGFNLGVQLTPFEGTQIGIGYRSSISHSLEGRLALPIARIPARADLDTPDIVSVGLRQDVTERFRLLGTVEWDNWSRLGKVPVNTASSDVLLTTLHLDYRDGWLYSVGGEYDMNERFTLRAGIGYEVAPLTVDNRDTRLPETNQLILSAGLTYRHSDAVSFDLGYTYSKGLGDGDIDIAPGNDRFLGVPFQGSSDLDVSILSAALNIAFDSALWDAR